MMAQTIYLTPWLNEFFHYFIEINAKLHTNAKKKDKIVVAAATTGWADMAFLVLIMISWFYFF